MSISFFVWVVLLFHRAFNFHPEHNMDMLNPSRRWSHHVICMICACLVLHSSPCMSQLSTCELQEAAVRYYVSLSSAYVSLEAVDYNGRAMSQSKSNNAFFSISCYMLVELYMVCKALVPFPLIFIWSLPRCFKAPVLGLLVIAIFKFDSIWFGPLKLPCLPNGEGCISKI